MKIEAESFADLLRVSAVRLPPIPKNFGHGLVFGNTGWLMLGNGPDDTVFSGFQGCGDCAWAGPGHEHMEAGKVSKGVVPKFSGKTIVKQYSAYSGYNPVTGSNDNGSDIQEVITWRQTKGIYDDTGAVYKIGKAVALEAGNIDQLWAAAYLFECVGVGVQFQQAQMDQLDAGVPWSYVPGSPIEGGHYIPVMGNNGLITWGQRQGFVSSWYEHLNDESFAFIDPLRYNKVTGQTAEKFSDYDLERYITAVVKVKGRS